MSLTFDKINLYLDADAGVTPALRRRRERAERHRTFINEQEIINETRRGSQSSEWVFNHNIIIVYYILTIQDAEESFITVIWC